MSHCNREQDRRGEVGEHRGVDGAWMEQLHHRSCWQQLSGHSMTLKEVA